MIKAITFDLDGVYFVNGKANFIKALSSLGVTENEAIRVFLKSDQMNKLYKTGRMTDEEYWQWAINEWKLKLSVVEVIELLIKGYEINSKVIETVIQVRANGYKTLICSNNFPARVNGLQARFKFLDNFDAVVFSYQAGAIKPSRIIFSELVKRAGVQASEIVFADDNNSNLEGAKEIGINAFFYEGFDKFIGQLGELGVNL